MILFFRQLGVWEAPESARAHEVRDVLARSIPYVFHAAGSADGQLWLQRAGQDGSVLRSW